MQISKKKATKTTSVEPLEQRVTALEQAVEKLQAKGSDSKNAI